MVEQLQSLVFSSCLRPQELDRSRIKILGLYATSSLPIQVMPVIGRTAMGTPFFDELKKQASYFLKEKVRAARLALTDVTPAEL